MSLCRFLFYIIVKCLQDLEGSSRGQGFNSCQRQNKCECIQIAKKEKLKATFKYPPSLGTLLMVSCYTNNNFSNSNL